MQDWKDKFQSKQFLIEIDFNNLLANEKVTKKSATQKSSSKYALPLDLFTR